MDYETKKAYSEICAILEYMPNEYVAKIPRKIIEFFKSEKLENYEVKIDKSNLLDKNHLSKKTMVIIAMINYKYWCPNKKVKDDLYNQYLENNKVFNKEKYEKCKADNLFKIKRTKEIETNEKIKKLIEYEERNCIQKILDKIKNIFKIKW